MTTLYLKSGILAYTLLSSGEVRTYLSAGSKTGTIQAYFDSAMTRPCLVSIHSIQLVMDGEVTSISSVDVAHVSEIMGVTAGGVLTPVLVDADGKLILAANITLADNTAVTVSNEVEIKNDSGNPVPTSANLQVGGAITTQLNQIPTNVSEFEISKEITLSAGASAYTANDLINADSATTLPELDFGAIIGSASARKIQINSIQITSSNGAAATKLVPEVVLYNANALTGQTLTDNTAFNPTYAQHVLKKATSFSKNENWNTDFNYGAFYELRLTELVRNCTLDAAGKLFLALIATNAYTPAASEKFTITIKFYLLN